MTKTGMNIVAPLAVVLVAAGCSKVPARPRFEGRIVSHVDEYGSGTGGESALSADGSMISGFDYGDPAGPDWTSDIKWRFLRRDGSRDVYRVGWTFRPKGGSVGTKTKEAAFDGMDTVRVFENQWQVISIEPGPMKRNSQRIGGEERS
jgi:hypothetical protein